MQDRAAGTDDLERARERLPKHDAKKLLVFALLIACGLRPVSAPVEFSVPQAWFRFLVVQAARKTG